MTNQEIATKLAWISRAIDKYGQARSKGGDAAKNWPSIYTPVQDYNDVRTALNERLKHFEATPWPSNWRDALEIKLLYSEDQIRAAAKVAGVSLDD